MGSKYLTLQERWALDNEYAKKYGELFKISIPQCEICNYWKKGNAEQCKKYTNIKPKEVLRCKKECPEFQHNELLQIKLGTKVEGQLLGAIFGFCVADALGVPVEFTSREERQKDPVREMRAYGTYHQYFGTWSDDSSMTFCLMDSLKDGYNLKDIANKFCKFYYGSYWTPRNEVFDIGNTTVQAIEKMRAGMNPIECGGKSEKDNGNGALMRVLPLAFYLKNKSIIEKIKVVGEISALTHAHKCSKLACIIYVEFTINLISGLSKEKAYQKTQEFVLFNCKESFYDEFIKFNRLLMIDISSLNEKEIKSSGYVIDSLEAAFWSFMTSKNYKETILKAINLGGDTDTIAAIGGGLAGIYYGLEQIPNNWIQCLARKEDIFQLILEFGRAF